MNQYPVITIHGLFGWGEHELPIDYWGKETHENSPLPIFESAVGPVSSFHDRACEFVAQVKGTRVDYGAKHAKLHNHKRYGKSFAGKGIFPEWSESNPIHLVGHSAGGNTMRMVQYLLDNDYFGFGSTYKWVKSVSAISSVLNGTALPYLLGCDRTTGLVKKDSLSDFLGWMVQCLAMISGGSSAIKYDFDLEQWGYTHDNSRSIGDTIRNITELKLLHGKDNLAYDLTLQGCHEFNKFARDFPETYYFGYTTEQTFGIPVLGVEYPSLRMNPLTRSAAAWQGRYNFEKNPPFHGWGSGNLTNKLWHKNDGCVPEISQRYPFSNSEMWHLLMPRPISEYKDFKPGRWYSECTTQSLGISFDHLDIVCGSATDPLVKSKKSEFYSTMWKRLAAL